MPTVSFGQAIITQNETENITATMDSMLNLWYVKTSKPSTGKYENKYGFTQGQIPTYSDSIYSARIKNIKTTLPLVYNDKVRAYIDLYAVKKRGLSQNILGMSDYYFPLYEEVLDKHDMPLEIKFLSIVESALNPRAVSPCGATGLWQFMYSTGRLYRLNITTLIDERKDPLKSTEAAAQYLYDLHNIFGDWFLAIAAYNCGPGNVNKAIKRSGGKRTFWEIYNYLPLETRAYVPAFIAATYVFTYPQEHNLNPNVINLPLSVDTVLVNKSLHFESIANSMGISIDLLRDLNPQYKKDIIPSDAGSLSLRLPASKSYLFSGLADSMYAYEDLKFNTPLSNVATSVATIQSTSVKESDTNKISGTNPEVKMETATVTYVVKQGETITQVADMFDVSIYGIRRWNSLTSNILLKSQRLKILVPIEKYDFYALINTMETSKKQQLLNGTLGTDSLYAQQNTSVVKPVVKPTYVYHPPVYYKYYTVQKGDTLWGIAQKYPGVTANDIQKLNKISTSLRPGQKLKIQTKKG